MQKSESARSSAEQASTSAHKKQEKSLTEFNSVEKDLDISSASVREPKMHAADAKMSLGDISNQLDVDKTKLMQVEQESAVIQMKSQLDEQKAKQAEQEVTAAEDLSTGAQNKLKNMQAAERSANQAVENAASRCHELRVSMQLQH